ncbi:MAG: Gfo/Idh/MocA family oxidoreductase [Planctomycetota bacterium]
MSKTKVGVIGVGHHGRHHARNLAAMTDVELVGVVDASESNAKAIADLYHTKAYADPGDLLDKVDAVCVVVPTVAHHPVAIPFLRRGIATFVEKPLAFRVDEAKEMVRLADRHQAVLQVGHIERYNPAWVAAERYAPRPTYMQALRLSKFPFRGLDVSVVFDVMIHDLELVLSLAECQVESVDVTGMSMLSQTADRVETHLRFSNGARADLVASRVHHEPVRQMRLWSSAGHLEIDFMRRTSTTMQAHSSVRAASSRHFSPSLTVEEREAMLRDMFAVETVQHDAKVEPIRLELEDFVHCQRHGESPKVAGRHGCAAVELAHRIEMLLQESEIRPALRKSA